VSRNGTLIYRQARGNVEMPMTALWLGPAERGDRWSLRPGAYTQLSLSPDGRNAAMTVVTRGGFAVWLYDCGRDVLSPLTSGTPPLRLCGAVTASSSWLYRGMIPALWDRNHKPRGEHHRCDDDCR
jgi:hypothetical protein